MAEATIYFAGPATVWAGKVDPREIIARREFLFAWMAKWWARRMHGELDPTRVGYVVTNGEQQLVHVTPR